MIKKKKMRIGMLISLTFLLFGVFSCGGGSSESKEAEPTDDEAFYSTQPMKSGLYDASHYDIKGNNERKGPFDGRVYVCLGPKRAALYVFENGNRTKINFPIDLTGPFEKTDSGVYVTTDKKDRLVKVWSDSTDFCLNFQRSGEDYTIRIAHAPRQIMSASDTFTKIEEKVNQPK